MSRDELIKKFSDYVYYFNAYCTSDAEDHEMLKAVLALLKEHDELLRKKQHDVDRLCNEISEWKHKFHDKLLKEQEPIKPKSKVRHGEACQYQHWCGNCMVMLHGKPKFCPNCGRAVKWE